MQIEVTPNKPKKPTPTIEEKITEVANSWAQSLIDENVGNYWITEGLTDALNAKISEQLGFRIRTSSWESTKIEVDMYSNKPLANLIREHVDKEVRRIIDEIEFEPVVLTQAEVNAIQRAYRTRIKEHAIEAARSLAQERAIDLAKAVLGLEES